MKTVRIIIEKSKDHYSAYAENITGIYGAGDTVEEAKTSILEAIRLLMENNSEKNIPAILKGDYALVFKFDMESLLKYYGKVFTKSALEHITGINQRQLQHYSSGLKKPRPAQKEKLQKALHALGSELMSVEL
ncbi:type II toxin-antitoxin system HicB family antitoxin [Filimonas effusa]|uniref:Type II toxin-antitoxin system HicB family antitoxin n=1 Tax=Filimonas effusa TaxID=2508721 RepID=A0A4Q1D6X7_9BACT|nr:type II toxin-antitoxin system HicB family antitoxin [Filimonas effusa]RXK83427.1 type II toxin-antitoxin system HicB family antitoxin [Filimonas effusa]